MKHDEFGRGRSTGMMQEMTCGSKMSYDDDAAVRKGNLRVTCKHRQSDNNGAPPTRILHSGASSVKLEFLKAKQKNHQRHSAINTKASP
jgi:hypothetical protein